MQYKLHDIMPKQLVFHLKKKTKIILNDKKKIN